MNRFLRPSLPAQLQTLSQQPGGPENDFVLSEHSIVRNKSIVFLPSKTRKLKTTLSVLFWLAGLGSGWSADIQGHVLSSGSPVGHALSIQLLKQNPNTLIYDYVADTSSNPTTGAYRLNGLADGFYHVQVLDLTGEYAAEIYEDVYREADATMIEIKNGVALIDPVDFEVQPGATVSGRVVAPDGTPIPGLAVGIEETTDTETLQLAGASIGVGTDANGEFKVGLRPGVYTVAFWEPSDSPYWATQLFSNTIAHEWATPIVLASVGQHVSNVNATLQPGYEVSGQVRDTNGMALAGVFASFEVYDPNRGEWGTTVSKRTGPDGLYAINFTPGEYRVKFEEDSLLYEQEYWSDAAEPDNATPINVVAASVSGIDAQLEYTPLARWAFGYGLNPFANVAGWLKDDPDSDGYDNFREFAFGTDPTDASSGFEYLFGPVVNSTVSISGLVETNLSTAYWLEYQLQQRSSLGSGSWIPSPISPTPVPGPFPQGYLRVGITVPTSPDPMLFFRTRATMHPY
jgi:hypothetical protein